MNLTAHINHTDTMQDLCDVIIMPMNALRVSSKVSFLGKRSTQVSGFEGDAEIDALAAKVIHFTRLKGFEYSSEERKAGNLVAEKINRIYELSDEELEKCNFITRFFCCVRESFASLKANGWEAFSRYSLYSKTRWNWLECFPKYSHWHCEVFSYYTLKQYIDTFGRAPDEWSLKRPLYLKLFPEDLVPGLYLRRSEG